MLQSGPKIPIICHRALGYPRMPTTWQACGTSLKILIRRLSAVNRTAAQISQAPKPASLSSLPLFLGSVWPLNQEVSDWEVQYLLCFVASQLPGLSSTNGIVSPAILGDVGVVSHSRTLAIVVHTRKGVTEEIRYILPVLSTFCCVSRGERDRKP